MLSHHIPLALFWKNFALEHLGSQQSLRALDLLHPDTSMKYERHLGRPLAGSVFINDKLPMSRSLLFRVAGSLPPFSIWSGGFIG